MISSPWPAPRIPEVDFTSHVLRHADRLADRAALVDAADGRQLTYGALAAAARRTAAGLAARGFGRGDVLAIYSPNTPEFAVLVLGAAMAGGTITMINPLYTVGELASALRDSRAQILVTIPPLMRRAMEAGHKARVLSVLGYGDLTAGAEPPVVAIAPDDVVLLPYSSGTTGLPKGVELTHRAAVANLVQIESALTLDPDDVVLAMAPMAHVMGLIVVVCHALCQGATVVTMARFEPEKFLQAMQDNHVTASIVAPPIALALATHPAVERFDLSALRWLGCGAAPLDWRIEGQCAQRLACAFGQGYGMTETTGAIALASVSVADRIVPGTVGQLLPGTQARVTDPETGADLGAGAEGELLIRGPQLMRGYRGHPDATAKTIDADGWLHTGDLGTVSSDGVIRITDRIKELIKVKGLQVPPAELEGLLCAHPSVADAAVIGVPDETASEVPKAFVVARGEVTADQLIGWVAERVAPHKRICAVEFVDAVPRLPSGKTVRRVLRAATVAP
ncbi:MAG: AMP-binding protein [Solirubrobacterales bacterium]|nr:AMP-binding protein [Solirubrobacterales bacterium]